MNINWYGNNGSCNPLPGTLATANCGVCGSPMNVRRNVLGPTGLAEAMSGNKHLHDKFTCPKKTESWHIKIYRLKMKVYKAEINEADNLEEMRNGTGKVILEILKTNGIN